MRTFDMCSCASLTSRDDYRMYFVSLVLLPVTCSTGKTCIVNRYSKGSYPTKANPTVSIDFTLKTVRVSKRSVTLQVS